MHRTTFKAPLMSEWTIVNEGIWFKGKSYPMGTITSAKMVGNPTVVTNGVIQIGINGRDAALTLAYPLSQHAEAQKALDFIIANMGTAEEREKRHKESIGVVYDLRGVRGRQMKVYEDRVVINVTAGLGSLVTGNFTDGEKTIYYADCIGVQFKESGGLLGYLQLETASNMMNMMKSNFFNENTFTFDTSVQTNEKMREVYNYVREKVTAFKQGTPAEPQLSTADEIKKYKELLDMGAISQEEFDAKKKQLLGL